MKPLKPVTPLIPATKSMQMAPPKKKNPNAEAMALEKEMMQKEAVRRLPNIEKMPKKKAVK